MEAGRDLDAAIAEKVMGCTSIFIGTDGVTKYCNCNRKSAFDHGTHEDGHFGIKPYSTDIADAWLVVEQLKLRFGFSLHSTTSRGFGWMARIYRDNGAVISEELAPTAPLVICLAALKTKEMK